MDDVYFIELRASIACGELNCLVGCCQSDPRTMHLIWRTMRALRTESDLALFSKMLCGCALNHVAPPQITAGPDPNLKNCYDRTVDWVRDNQGSIDALQMLLVLASGSSIPALAQAAAVASGALELLEDAAKPGRSITSELVGQICRAVNAVETFRRQMVSNLQLPDSLKGIIELLTRMNIVSLLDSTCCPPTATTPPAMQLPPGGNTGTGEGGGPPALPPTGGSGTGVGTGNPAGASPPPLVNVGCGCGSATSVRSQTVR